LTNVVLRESFFQPALIRSSVILLAILICGVVVDACIVGYPISRLVLVVARPIAPLLLRRLLLALLRLRALKIALLPELVALVFARVAILNREHAVFLGLLNSLLGVDVREVQLSGLRVEREQRNLPFYLLIVPLTPLMQLVEFVLTEKDPHYFIAELNGLFLASDDVQEFRFLLLVLLSKITNLTISSFVFGT